MPSTRSCHSNASRYGSRTTRFTLRIVPTAKPRKACSTASTATSPWKVRLMPTNASGFWKSPTSALYIGRLNQKSRFERLSGRPDFLWCGLYILVMSDAAHALTHQFLAWVAEAPRSYAEADAWRRSCPHLSIWEDAISDGLVQFENGSSMKESRIVLTARGRRHLSGNS